MIPRYDVYFGFGTMRGGHNGGVRQIIITCMSQRTTGGYVEARQLELF